MPSGHPRQILAGGFRLLALEFAPDGCSLASLQWIDGPKLWSVSFGRWRETLVASSSRVRALAYSPNRLLATAGSDQAVNLWDIDTGQLLARLRGHGEEIWAIAFSPDGTLIASGGRDEVVFLWPAAPPRRLNHITGLVERLGSPTFTLSRNGDRVAALRADGLGIWSTARPQSPDAIIDVTVPLGFHPDAHSLVALRSPASLLTWDVEGQRLLTRVELPVPFDEDSSSRLSPSGRWLALGSANATLCLIDTRTSQLVAGPQPHDRHVLALGFAAREPLLVSSARGGDAFVWQVPSLKRLGVIRGHKDYIRGLAISPDAKQLATASADCTARIWSLPDGAEIRVLRGHSEDVIDAAFCPDSRTRFRCLWTHDIHVPSSVRVRPHESPGAPSNSTTTPVPHELPGSPFQNHQKSTA